MYLLNNKQNFYIMGKLFVFLTVFGLAMLVVGVQVGIIYLVWNHVIAYLFSMPEVTFWQALGIAIVISFITKLLKILFKKND